MGPDISLGKATVTKREQGLKKRFLGVLILAVLLVSVAAYWWAWRGASARRAGTPSPPAPEAAEAPDWSPGEMPSGKPDAEAAQEPPPPPESSYDFDLPLQYTFDDLPEVPENIRGPTPEDAIPSEPEQ